jgi:hypothetical protein
MPELSIMSAAGVAVGAGEAHGDEAMLTGFSTECEHPRPRLRRPNIGGQISESVHANPEHFIVRGRGE